MSRPSRGGRGTLVVWLMFGAVAPSTALAQVVDVPVTNPSFEQPAVAAGTFDTVAPPPPGWSDMGTIDFNLRTVGVLDPATTTLYSSVPDGENVGVVFLLDDFGNQSSFAGVESGMEQVLSTSLELNTRYTLTVEVGNIANDPNPPHNQFQFSGFPGYRIELFAGNTVLGSEGSLLPGEGSFLTSTVDVVIGSFHLEEGQSLGIRLINLNAAPGIEVNFDNVRLQSSPIAPVPAIDPAAAALLLGLLLVMGRRLL